MASGSILTQNQYDGKTEYTSSTYEYNNIFYNYALANERSDSHFRMQKLIDTYCLAHEPFTCLQYMTNP